MVDSDQYDSAELEAIARFVSQVIPFHELSPALLAKAVNHIEICYHRQGERFDVNTEVRGLRLLRSGAVEVRDGRNKLLDRLGESESFHIHGLTSDQTDVQAFAIEDCLIYLLPEAAYQSLREQDRAFDRFFHSQRSRRLRRAARYEPTPNAVTRPVSDVMTSNLLLVNPDESVKQVAARMSEWRVSSAFVVRDDKRLLGIVTDRDLRERIVAAGLPATTPVADIMTPDPQSVAPATTLFEATLFMTQKRFHHLPVMQDEMLLGIVTTSDMNLARQDDPVYLVQHLSRQDSVEGLHSLLEGMSNLVVQWTKSGIPARQVSRILTAISDAVTNRLIELGIDKLGPAPADFCWVAFGSQGRAEQMLGADQDNGLILSNDVREQDLPWFADLAAFVCHGLDACGYRLCPGDVMAQNPEWCVTLEQWQKYVHSWTREPTADAVMRVTIFFDLRGVYGEMSLANELRQTMLQEASANTIFLAALTANALDASAPIGIFRRFVVERNGEHRDTLDLKKRGVMPVTDIARIHALAARVPSVNTDERLAALAEHRKLTINESRDLTDALHVVQRLRLHNQADQVMRGEQADNYIDPRNLPKLAKEQLRDAFSIIDEAQLGIKQRYRTGLA